MVLACFYLRSLVRAIALLLCASLTAAQVAVVRTPDDLQVAISRRVPHIVVADHLDLTMLAPQSGRKGELVLFVVPKAVRSITVCLLCPLRELARRCLLRVQRCGLMRQAAWCISGTSRQWALLSSDGV